MSQLQRNKSISNSRDNTYSMCCYIDSMYDWWNDTHDFGVDCDYLTLEGSDLTIEEQCSLSNGAVIVVEYSGDIPPQNPCYDLGIDSSFPEIGKCPLHWDNDNIHENSIVGCMDSTSCSYHQYSNPADVIIHRASDCLGGLKYFEENGEEWDGTNCYGACDGDNLTYDDCPTCEGSDEVIGSDGWFADGTCNCFGDTNKDDCGVCGGTDYYYDEDDSSTWASEVCACATDVDGSMKISILDCLGVCGGSAVENFCGECGGPDHYGCTPEGEEPPCEVTWYLDGCNVCDGGNEDCEHCYEETGDRGLCGTDCNKSLDCAGVCEGSSQLDNCGVCNGVKTELDADGFYSDATCDCNEYQLEVNDFYDDYGTCGGDKFIVDYVGTYSEGRLCDGWDHKWDACGICGGNSICLTEVCGGEIYCEDYSLNDCPAYPICDYTGIQIPNPVDTSVPEQDVRNEDGCCNGYFYSIYRKNGNPEGGWQPVSGNSDQYDDFYWMVSDDEYPTIISGYATWGGFTTYIDEGGTPNFMGGNSWCQDNAWCGGDETPNQFLKYKSMKTSACNYIAFDGDACPIEFVEPDDWFSGYANADWTVYDPDRHRIGCGLKNFAAYKPACHPNTYRGTGDTFENTHCIDIHDFNCCTGGNPEIPNTECYMQPGCGNKIFNCNTVSNNNCIAGTKFHDAGCRLEEWIPPPCTLGDLNDDGAWNVLDIVTLANCVLAGTCVAWGHECSADLNGDGGFNVLDIVTLANCVLAGTCCNLPGNNGCGRDAASQHKPPPGMTEVEQREILRDIINGPQDIQSINDMLGREVPQHLKDNRITQPLKPKFSRQQLQSMSVEELKKIKKYLK